MARRTAPRRRVVVGGGGARRTIKAPAAGPQDELALDDRPLAITVSADARHLIVSLPWELWIVDARTLAARRTIPLNMARPSVSEGWEGALWIGGQHLHRGNVQAASASKVGSKLGGYVDHVALVRDDLLCGVGSQGEILWDIDREGPVHRRKSSGPDPVALVASADSRAVFADGSPTCWVIDPAHTEGYAKLELGATSPVPVEGEAVVCLGRTAGTRGGRVLLAARDGAVAWTTHDLRLAGERVPQGGRDQTPLAVAGDERWVYVLRRRGVLQRFLIAQPPEVLRAQKAKQKANKRGKGQPLPQPDVGGKAQEPELEPLPLAQQVRLGKLAECLALLISEQDDRVERTLVLGGSKADGQLGRLWTVDPESLDWEPLELGERELAEAPAEDEGADAAGDKDKEKPSFVATRNKPAGPKIAALEVDDIVGAKVDFWLTTATGTLVERPTERKPADELLPADTLVLPAMVRFAEGTARPALLVWPGVVEDHEGPTPEPCWLVWGDEPRGWIPLETPQIRKQKWSRTEVFPMQVALAGVPEGVPGRRAKLEQKWIDREHFLALAKECKKMLKVLW